jgi:hypothetical protein
MVYLLVINKEEDERKTQKKKNMHLKRAYLQRHIVEKR